MKLSVYDPSPLNELAEVYLDGVEQTHVVIADEEGGYIMRYSDITKGLHLERKEGKVEIRFIEPEKIDPVVEAVRADLLQRSKIGVKKYGITLADNKGDFRYWLQHAYEETLDHANYLKRAIMELEKQNGK